MTQRYLLDRSIFLTQKNLAQISRVVTKGKQNSTHVRKEVVWGAELLRKGLRWEVRSGRCVQFWRDIWLGKESLGEMSQTTAADVWATK